MNAQQLTPILATIFFVGAIPFLAVVATSFSKIAVTLLIVRNALGIQQTPPNIIIYAIAIILSAHIMMPVGVAGWERVQALSIDPNSLADLQRAAIAALEPLSDFLELRASDRTKSLFGEAAKVETKGPGDVKYFFSVLLPSFLADELTRAFKIGLMIYVPLALIDFVVSAILIALGMQMMSATTISTPIKILAFVAVEGWTRMLQNFLLSYTG
jgi:type III secretion protein R